MESIKVVYGLILFEIGSCFWYSAHVIFEQIFTRSQNVGFNVRGPIDIAAIKIKHFSIVNRHLFQ